MSRVPQATTQECGSKSLLVRGNPRQRNRSAILFPTQLVIAPVFGLSRPMPITNGQLMHDSSCRTFDAEINDNAFGHGPFHPQYLIASVLQYIRSNHCRMNVQKHADGRCTSHSHHAFILMHDCCLGSHHDAWLLFRTSLQKRISGTSV
jgi:hypothetical protein